MPYKVTCPLVLAKGQDGHTHHCYEGDVIRWLPDDQRDWWLAEGWIEEIDTAQVDAINLAEARRQKQADEAEAERVGQCVDVLNEIELPLSAGAPQARAAIRERGHRFGNDTIASAVKQRRALSRTAGMPAYPQVSEEVLATP
jgi:hypothetical protein